MTINQSKSIQRGHVFYTRTHWTDTVEFISFYFVHTMLIGLLIIPSTYMIIKEIIADNLGVFVLTFASIQIAFGIYSIICLINWRKLTQIEGVDFLTNKKLLNEIINSYYPGLKHEWDGNTLICSRPYDSWRMRWGRNVTLLFQDKDVYINILSVFRGPNPWLTFTNIDRAKEIRDLFLEKIRYSQTPHNTMFK